jgi:hypothetical protein
MAKIERVRKVIVDLPKYGIQEINDVSTDDYELIKLAIINSIKGEQIALEERTRQKFVVDVYLEPAKLKGILDYQDLSQTGKCDFVGEFISTDRRAHFGLEVKGGEGNSVTLLERPRDADVFIVWSHLDVMSNTPAENMRAVLARVVKQMINVDEKRQKVDFLVFYDEWYKTGVKSFRHGKSLPDVFVFPESIPTERNRHPKLPAAVERNPFVTSIFKVVAQNDIDSEARKHIWFCDIGVEQDARKWWRRMKTFNAFDPNITFTEQEYTKAACKPADYG